MEIFRDEIYLKTHCPLQLWKLGKDFTKNIQSTKSMIPHWMRQKEITKRQRRQRKEQIRLVAVALGILSNDISLL
jgi:hypothetical protein